MNSLTFGRYSAFNSFTHKLDPRNKILLMILLMVGIFFQFTLWSVSLIMSVIYLILLVVLMAISKVSFIELFKSLKSMWLMVIVLLLIYIFIPSGNPTLPTVFTLFNSYEVHWDSFCRAAYIILRIIMMLSITMVLTSTTRPMDMTYAFEWYMTPLKLIKFPAHEIAMTLSIALRFIPTLLEETNRIMKAQESRGADFSHGFFRRFRAIISLIIPLFVSSIDRSEELANAMEVRGYDPKEKRTKYRILKFTGRDIIALLVGLTIFGGILTLFIFDQKTEGGIDLINLIFNVKGF